MRWPSSGAFSLSGWLYVVVREGSGVRAASWQGSLPRYFTDLTHDTLAAALHAAGFTIHEHNTWPAPNQHRLAPHHRPKCD